MVVAGDEDTPAIAGTIDIVEKRAGQIVHLRLRPGPIKVLRGPRPASDHASLIAPAFLGPVLAVARCVRLRRIDGLTVAYALSGPIGLGVVAATQAAQVDDPAAFAKGQEGWDRALSAPWVPIYRATDGIIDKLPRPAMELGLNLAAILLVGAALVVVTARLRGGTSAWGFIGWGWVAWFTPLWTAVPSSHVRFAIAAWPAFAVAGDDDSR